MGQAEATVAAAGEKSDGAGPKLWDKRSQQCGAVVGFLGFMSFGVLFFEGNLSESAPGLAVFFKFIFFIASPFLAYVAWRALHRGDHRASSFCCAFLTVSSLLVSFTALRFTVLTVAPVAIEGPSFQQIGGLGYDDFGWLKGEGILPMTQPSGLSCIEHVRKERLKTGLYPCGESCACIFFDERYNRTISWNLMGHLPDRLDNNGDIVMPGTTKNSAHTPMWVFPSAAFLHILPSILVLALGPLQLNVHFRKANYARHRIIGWVYSICVLLGAAGAWYLTVVSTQAMWASLSFVFLAAAWAITLLCAIYHILQRDRTKDSGDGDVEDERVELHKEWMTRNYGLTFAATSLRWEMAALQAIFGYDLGYGIVSWTCWIPNAIIVEFYIQRARRLKEEGKGAGKEGGVTSVEMISA